MGERALGNSSDTIAEKLHRQIPHLDQNEVFTNTHSHPCPNPRARVCQGMVLWHRTEPHIHRPAQGGANGWPFQCQSQLGWPCRLPRVRWQLSHQLLDQRYAVKPPYLLFSQLMLPNELSLMFVYFSGSPHDYVLTKFLPPTASSTVIPEIKLNVPYVYQV